jgi:prepilin signal peptidase PulO-like enzyme (type II secretory pathway)
MLPVTIFAFIYGAALGSFANVMADRLRVKSFWGGRSECLTCAKKLSWYELVPVLSYLFQKGRCRGCRSKLSQMYLWSEVVSGLLVAGLVYILPLYTTVYVSQFLLFLLWSFIICISMAIIIYDIRHTIVPFEMAMMLLFTGICMTLGRQFVSGFNIYDLLSGLIIAAPFAIMYFISSGRWVGMGDIIIYAAFGFMLGLPLGATMFFYSVWLGAFVSIAMLMVHRKDYNLKSEIPFTPFIILASILVLYTRSDILGLYDILF